ncbi:hypothetical protein [Novosphingobium sp.]|uniref:hypothetical protein n=1 Tax=Novosphingobium sp. TaxID=1874826 RepID=UPI002625B570|nr:hypothetical protein [Novosphingobium sp.]
MPSLLLAAPAVVLGKLAWVSLRTGGEWMRHRQWDAVATHLAIGAALGGMAAGLAVMALPERG